MSKIKVFVLVVASMFVFWSCIDDTKTNEVVADTLANEVNIDDQTVIPENTSFKLPSPVELYIFLWEEEASFKKEVLNDMTNVTKYFTTASKATNFGIYASDLAYCTVFGKNQETFAYFTTVKTLADDMGLTEGFDAVIAKRIEENINNGDSLYEITNASYADATNFLESQKQGNILPFILSGAWVESVFIAISSVDQFSENSEIVIRVAEQQFLLENLMEYLSTVEKNDDLKELIKKMKDLRDSYDKLYENTDVIITKEQYDEISSKVVQIRNEFIS